jgi:hypothetical protein
VFGWFYCEYPILRILCLVGFIASIQFCGFLAKISPVLAVKG